MITAVALALLSTVCVLGQKESSQGIGDTRANIQRDLQNVIDSVTTTQNAAKSIVQSTASMKLKRQQLCWKLAVNRVLATSLPANNGLTQLYQEFDDLSKKLPSASDEQINGYLYDVLEGDNSYITRALATGDKLKTNVDNQIKGLSLDLTC